MCAMPNPDRDAIAEVSDNAPVLVGIGLAAQREEDPESAREPLELMMEAVRAAGRDSGDESNLRHVERISVPRGRWSYGDPGRLIAERIGVSGAITLLGRVGVLQQTLVGLACQSVWTGENAAVLVVGGEAGYRIQRAAKTGLKPSETKDTRTPDEVLSPSAHLRSPAERAAGFDMPVGLYAMMESALRTARGETLQQQKARIGTLYEQFSAVAAGNPHAWRRDALSAEAITTPGPGNRMQSSPYTKLHCADWSVDQASALLIMSAGLARQLGVPAEKWVHAVASSESNHMQTVTSRRALHRSPGARLAGQAALDAGGMRLEDVSLLDLYTCFPVASEIVADELGLATERVRTITGGMAYAGGPYNNYVLHATAQMAERLRAGEGGSGLVGCISGVMTKQAFGLWSMKPAPNGFAFLDVTEAVAAETDPIEEAETYEGAARIVAWTILHSRREAPKLVAIADTADGRRCVAVCGDTILQAEAEERDIAGEAVTITGNIFRRA